MTIMLKNLFYATTVKEKKQTANFVMCYLKFCFSNILALNLFTALSAGALEYTDCTSAEG